MLVSSSSAVCVSLRSAGSARSASVQAIAIVGNDPGFELVGEGGVEDDAGAETAHFVVREWNCQSQARRPASILHGRVHVDEMDAVHGRRLGDDAIEKASRSGEFADSFGAITLIRPTAAQKLTVEDRSLRLRPAAARARGQRHDQLAAEPLPELVDHAFDVAKGAFV